MVLPEFLLECLPAPRDPMGRLQARVWEACRDLQLPPLGSRDWEESISN